MDWPATPHKTTLASRLPDDLVRALRRRMRRRQDTRADVIRGALDRWRPQTDPAVLSPADLDRWIAAYASAGGQTLVSVRVPAWLADRSTRDARRLGITISHLLRVAVAVDSHTWGYLAAPPPTD